MVPRRSVLRSFPFKALVLGGAVLSALLCTAQSGQERLDLAGEWPLFRGNVDWTVNRGDPSGTQFAALAQINAINVHKLRPAWEYHTGDASPRSTMYANPIVIDGTMYLSTASLKAVALDAATGREKMGLRSCEIQQRQGHASAQSRRGVLEGRRRRADLRLCPRQGLRHRCEIGPVDPILRKGRLYRSPRKPGRGSEGSRFGNDLARRGL